MTVREKWLNDFAKRAKTQFEAAGWPIPANVRMSVGFPSTGKRGRRIGECWSHSASADGQFEIFIHPTLDKSAEVAGVLTHELVHAAVGLEAKHGRKFRACAVALGLTGKMTATTTGPDWHKWADPILRKLGPIPHGSLNGASSSGPKKQTTRLIKCECDSCGFTFRTTQKWIDSVAYALRCPDLTCDGVVQVG